ncbi:MAG: AgmX/PglI C-terminal domain-containing protein [Myxococcaceae bacterium]
MSGQPSVLQVVILRDGLLVGTEVFVPGSYTLGSSGHADLRLDDGTVDAMHAVLYFQNGRAAIQDSGSSGGVFVNGHRITACEVRSADELALGPFTLKCRVLGQKPNAKAAPPPEVAALLKGSSPHVQASPTPAAAPTQAQRRPPPQAPAPKAAPPPPQPPPSAPAGTMLSARRLAAVASQPSPAPQQSGQGKGGGHLRAMSAAPQFEDDIAATESVPIPNELLATTVPTAQRRPQAPAAVPRAASRRTRGSRGQAPTVAVPAASRSNPRLSAADSAKGAPKLFFELYWGEVRREAKSFGLIKPKKPVLAAHRGDAALPLWGFSLPNEPMIMAEQTGSSYRVFIPPKAAVEKRQNDDNFYPVNPGDLEARGSRKCVILSNGQAARFSEGEMSLVVYVQPALQQPFVSPLYGVAWLPLGLLTFFLTGFLGFLLFGPQPSETADFMQKDLPPVAVRLIAPEPKKKEEAKKKLEAIKQKAPKKKEVPIAEAPKHKQKMAPAVASAPETKALKALAKLTAAGPASGDILAAVDKLGNGPGAKNSKYKLSGLIGKAPIANAGLGTFGLGGGGGGGFGTKGAEILRGRGGGGIGALGAGGVGRGKVGGTVTRASARSLGVSGSIDREAVAKTVNSHLQEVRACYERALLKEPGLAGKVVLEWTISTAGKVVTAKTKTSTLRNSSVEGCILQNLKGWIFPPAKGGVVIVSYPFLFNSVGY